MTFIIFIISLLILIITSSYLVNETDRLAASIKISPLVIGSTLIAFGTSLPEFSVTISSTYVLYALLAGYTIFLLIEIIWGEMGSKKEDKKALLKLKKEKASPIVTALKLLFAIALIIISSKFLVTSAEAIALFFKIKDEIIGLSLIAFGTSIPELSTSIASGLKKDWKLIIGDIQGSNIFNLSVLGAVTLLFSKDGATSLNITPFFYLAVATLISFYLTRKYEGENIPRYYGFLFITLYASYLWLIFL